MMPLPTAPPTARRGVVAGLACVGVAAAVGLQLVGEPALAMPLGSWDQLVGWVDETPAPVMAVALVRLGALVTSAYLALVLLVWVVADAAGWRRVARVAAHALPATVRCAATGSARFGLVAGVMVGAASPAAASPSPPATRDTPPATATMWRLDGQAPDRPLPATATMVLLDASRGARAGLPAPDATDVPVADATDTADVPGPEKPPMDSASVTAGVDTWEVEPGDSFWSIAEAVLSDNPGQPPASDGEIARYWARLVAANHDRLPAPGHPDLLIPGQILALPQPGP